MRISRSYRNDHFKQISLIKSSEFTVNDLDEDYRLSSTNHGSQYFPVNKNYNKS